MERRSIRTTFFISEFEEEEKWLECMQKQGWKFVKTDNKYYEFEKCPEEDCVYRLDFKADGLPEAEYLQLFEDCGWEFVQHWKHWFYFRKKRTGEKEDYSIFSDRESKIELCKRVLKGRLLRRVLLPTLIAVGAYCCALFLLDGASVNPAVRSVLSGLCMVLFALGLSYISIHEIGEFKKIKKRIAELKNPLD